MPAVVLVGIILHAPSLRVPILNEDEALYAAGAAAMSEGLPPYRAWVESKPPGIFYLYQAAFAVVGRYHMEALHALTILWVLATGLVLARLVGPRAGPYAALFYYVFTTVQEPSVLATQCELLFSLPLALAALLIARPGLARALGAGVLIGLATLIKPTAVSLLGAAGLWLLLQSPPPPRNEHSFGAAAGPSPRNEHSFRRLAALLAGFGGVWTVAWLVFRSLGVWDDLVYYAFRWTASMYLPTGFSELPWLTRFARKVGVWAVLLAVPWALAVRATLRERSGLTLLLGLWTAFALVMVCLGGRFFDHYFPAAVTPLAALAGLGASSLERPLRRGLIAAGTAIPALACFVLALDFEPAMLFLGDTGRGPYAEVARYLRDHTRPDDKVFVWGYFPLIYVAADRVAATRFVGCHYLTGYAAIGLGRRLPIETEDRLQVPGGFDQLLADLEERHAEVIVDTAPADLHLWSRYPLDRYPRLAEYVMRNFVYEAEVDHTVVYRRRSSKP